MTEFLVRHFVKEYEEIEKVSVRTAYGTLAGIVGIFCNLLLFAAKGIIGLLLNSISVTADAMNNLSDAGSSLISLVGVKMASKPADEDHPFGHGRIEYVSALIVAFLVLQVGFSFFKESIVKIKEPQMLKFQVVSVTILILSIGVKLWMGMFNKKLGKRIDSKVMMAVAMDSMGDVITTSATIFSILFWKFTGMNIDGIVGVGVALVVMWAGIGIARDTLEVLIGAAVSPEVYTQITDFVEHYEGLVGTHDLIVHNYGPGRSMATIHAEVPNDVDIEDSHEIIDRIEREALKYLGICLVIHMDPIETKNEQVLAVRKQVEVALHSLAPEVSLHDFRMVEGKDQVNLIFDMVVPYDYDVDRQRELKRQLRERVWQEDARYQCVITVDKSFVSGQTEGTGCSQ